MTYRTMKEAPRFEHNPYAFEMATTPGEIAFSLAPKKTSMFTALRRDDGRIMLIEVNTNNETARTAFDFYKTLFEATEAAASTTTEWTDWMPTG